METSLIELENVSVVRETTRILDDVTLCIPRKRHTAILGPNGSGKSSLLKLLTRDFYPSVESQQLAAERSPAQPSSDESGWERRPPGKQGAVRIFGDSVWEVSELRRRMGIVTPSLDYEFSFGRTGRMTVTDAVASGFTATRLKEFGPAVDGPMLSAIQNTISCVGMTDFAARRLETLSTGERRRAMIARAIVHQPDVFVLDEPTGGLDMTAKAIFLGVLDSLTKQDAMTMVLVTHHIDEIPPQMNHVILLDNGRVVFDGPKSDGITRDRISSLFHAAVEVTSGKDGWYRSEMIG